MVAGLPRNSKAGIIIQDPLIPRAPVWFSACLSGSTPDGPGYQRETPVLLAQDKGWGIQVPGWTTRGGSENIFSFPA